MNIKEVAELAEILNSGNLTVVEVVEGETKIRLERRVSAGQLQQSAFAPVVAGVKTDEVPVNFNNLTEIKSPIVGVFYSRPSPDAEPFVGIGDRVKKGDTVCIVEAMKMMNEITAEAEGEIVDICVKDGDIAEFGQVLFKMT